MSYIDYVIKGIIEREGGFSNRAADKGGPTNWGITQETLSGWLGREASIDDVKNLTRETAAQIYKALYIKAPGYLQLNDDALVEQLIDAGVNHGTKRARRLLQQALGVADDGVIGPVTIEAAKALKPYEVYCRFMAARLAYFAICSKGKLQNENSGGWANRCAIMIRTYCRAVQAPDAVEAKLELVAKDLNRSAKLWGHKPPTAVAVAGFERMAASVLACEKA